MSGEREYRVDELAREAGVKVRNLRYYQERGLLPPPRREGRIGWYSGEHLARLRLIADLLARGYVVNTIAELLEAQDSGVGVPGLLGLEAVMTQGWPQEEPVTLTAAELVSLYGDEATGENIARAVELGYLTVEGDSFVHVSRRLLDASEALVRVGVPLAKVLEEGAAVQRRTAELADRFVTLVQDHVIGHPSPRPLSAAEAQRIADAIEVLRPMAGDVVAAEFARVMARRVREEFGELLHRTQS
ncbi:MerR family transcriptional regulator [Streptomyces sp. NPDC091272]|uniref:MerR family transcriptional regulator n=1 Tax=Streptomyces sp. NPDC091272 TaxID=3365981 RepID=UPI003817BF92